MPHFKLTLGYDGTDFFGSQAQVSGRTVQSELEDAVYRLTGSPVRMAFAGRTDRGVHAIGQVASGLIDWQGSEERLRTALNAVGPDDIVVSAVEPVDPEFHARYSARWREYRYRIVVAETEPVLNRRYVWWRRREIDPDLASRACNRLVGRHSFGSFAGLGRSKSLTREQLQRTVFRCNWLELETGGLVQGNSWEMRISADGFLPQMVRNITAAVVLVGTGERPVEWIDEVLAAGDRRVLPAGAPPHGLVLWRVGYEKFDTGPGA